MIDSDQSIDPELLDMLEKWPSMTVDATMLDTIRASGELLLGEIVSPDYVDKQVMLVPGTDATPEIPLTFYRPADRADDVLPCIYHIHGGGYICGTAASHEPIHRQMVVDLNCMIVSVDYRLAPETPFPGPLEDCYAGLAWLYANAKELRVDPARIGLLGESAGGGLAAALALLARDRGVYPLAFQQLVYPMLDDRTCTAEPHPHAGRFVWNNGSNDFGWRSYLGHAPGAATVSPYAAAARAVDLSGLPPAFVSTGALDLFVDEDINYAARLVRAGVGTELHVYPGAIHGFYLHPTASVALQANRDAKDWLRRHLYP